MGRKMRGDPLFSLRHKSNWIFVCGLPNKINQAVFCHGIVPSLYWMMHDILFLNLTMKFMNLGATWNIFETFRFLY
jgi:hypothetical protein